jgi:hypothetical protein
MDMRVGRVSWGLIVLLAASAASEARAAEDPPVPAPPATRRSGMAIGVASGLAIASARGYPNDVTKIDVPELEANTGAGASLGTAFWIGGALADWLTIALGYQRGSFSGNGLDATGGGLHVRIETFPLFFRGGAWQDAGLSLFAGTGTYDVKRGNTTVAEGEGTSLVGVGAFFEPFRFWQLSTGPDLTYTHQFSRSLSAHSLVVGWRLAFYADP